MHIQQVTIQYVTDVNRYILINDHLSFPSVQRLMLCNQTNQSRVYFPVAAYLSAL